MIESQLLELKDKTIEFAHHVEDMLNESFSAIINNDKVLLENVINTKEPKANLMELEIDKLSITILAQYCPKAGNLREVLMMLKISTDLERMADHCVGICHSSFDLLYNVEFRKEIENISDESQQVGIMLKKSIMAFIESDTKLAKKVCKKDIFINIFRDEKTELYLSMMKNNPNEIPMYFELIKICDRLERIADLSTNIAEDVFFISKGKIIKHKKDKSNTN